MSHSCCCDDITAKDLRAPGATPPSSRVCPLPTDPHQLTELHDQQEGQCLHTDAQALEDIGVLQAPWGWGAGSGNSPFHPAPDPHLPWALSKTKLLFGPLWSPHLQSPHYIHTHTHPQPHTLIYPHVPTSGLLHCPPVP